MTSAAAAVICAIAGLVTYLAATEGQLDPAIWVGATLLVICLVLSAVGIVAGASHPLVSALFMQAWAGVLLIVVAGGIAAITAGVVSVLVSQGPHPTPRVEEIGTASSAILAGVAGLLASAASKLTPAWLSEKVIIIKYGKVFEAQPADQPMLNGYFAVRRDSFGVKPDGPLAGWGLRSIRRRLKLIQMAIQSQHGGPPDRQTPGVDPSGSVTTPDEHGSER